MTSDLVDIRGSADWIERLQLADGRITWIPDGIWDPWNHGESVMALAIAGRREACLRGLNTLADRQDADGGWTGDLGASVPLDAENRRLVADAPETARDTNFSGYVAVTVLRSLLALDALDQLPRYFPIVARAMDFVLAHQSPFGDIAWRAARSGDDLANIDSLRAGNASLYKSLECAILMGGVLKQDTTVWVEARRQLGACLRENDSRFDRQGTDRRRYAMDWYYPVLAGVLAPDAGKARLYARWNEFVKPGLGCRCVADEPWVTAAETAELALACLAAGKTGQAHTLLRDLAPLACDDGGYWMGWQFEENVVWPYEKPSWTAGALVLAADAIDGLTPGSALLIRNSVPELATDSLSSGAAELPASLSV